MYERNPGDTWAFTVIGDRLPIAAIIAMIYFGAGARHRVAAFGLDRGARRRRRVDRAEPVGRRHRAALSVEGRVAGSTQDPVPGPAE